MLRNAICKCPVPDRLSCHPCENPSAQPMKSVGHYSIACLSAGRCGRKARSRGRPIVDLLKGKRVLYQTSSTEHAKPHPYVTVSKCVLLTGATKSVSSPSCCHFQARFRWTSSVLSVLHSMSRSESVACTDNTLTAPLGASRSGLSAMERSSCTSGARSEGTST